MTKRVQLAVQVTLIACAVLVCTRAESCTRDEDCGKPNTYCYNTGNCANCTDCKLYSRKPGRECAKHKDQCGDCLPGMEADMNIDGSLSICRPIITTEPPDPIEDEGSNIAIIITGIVVVIVIVVALILIYFCTDWNCCSSCKITVHRFRSKCGNCLMKPDDRPPPYTERQPTAPPCEEPAPPASDVDISSVVIRPVEHDPPQTANAYAFPSTRVRHSPTYQTEEPEPSENDRLVEQPVSHDEDTQPSTWSPNADSTGPTSFQNSISNLQSLSISQPGEIVPWSETQSNTSRASSTISVNIPHNSSGNSGTSTNITMCPQINLNIVNNNYTSR